jgi:hypothetical protein
MHFNEIQLQMSLLGREMFHARGNFHTRRSRLIKHGRLVWKGERGVGWVTCIVDLWIVVIVRVVVGIDGVRIVCIVHVIVVVSEGVVVGVVGMGVGSGVGALDVLFNEDLG